MEDIRQAVLGLLGIGLIVAVAIAIGSVQGRLKNARTGSVLAPLVPVVGGTISDGRLRGTYQGHPVEAWPETRDPSPSVGDDTSSNFEVNTFNLKLAEVPGRQYWFCNSQPRLLGAPEFEFGGVLGRGSSVLDRLAGVAGYAPPDEALEERMRAAGLIDELSRLGVRDSGYLPKVTYAPPPSNEQLQRFAALARPEVAQAHYSGELTCEIELGTGTVPPPEAFRELLDTALRVVHINAEANPSENSPHPS